MDGAKIFCRIRSYLSTCRKQGVSSSQALDILLFMRKQYTVFIRHYKLDLTLGAFVKVLSTKFKLDASEIYEIILDVKSIGIKVSVISKEYPIIEDDSDNLFINPAIDGNAKLIISGDSHLLKVREYKGTEIITVNEFLKRYSVK